MRKHIPIRYFQEITNLLLIKGEGLVGNLEDRTFMYFKGRDIEHHNDKIYLVTVINNNG